MSTDAYKNVMNTRTVKRATPQSRPIPGREKEMVINGNGGFSFAVDNFTRLDRFLILGTEGGSYYASEKKLTKENAVAVIEAIKEDGVRVVNRVIEISLDGRAPKNDPALLVLALVMTHGDDEAKKAAYDALPDVARIGTDLLHFAEYLNGMRSWGRGVRASVGNWYNSKTPMKLAEQMVKYANRDGWTHADVIKLAHIKPATPTHDALFSDAMGTAKAVVIDTDVAEYMAAVEELKATRNVKRAVKLIEQFKLPREVVPTELLNEVAIWDALVPHMGIGALVRNLGKLTSVGYIAPLSNGQKLVIEKMQNADAVKGSRIHPIKVLTALMTYKMGHGVKGNLTWSPEGRVRDALDAMFYVAFQNVEPTNKNIMIALDVSASMTWNSLMGITGLTPRVASAALSMVVARTEPNHAFVAFAQQMRDIDITASMTLEQVITAIEKIPMGGTNCALPMMYAASKRVPVDAFVMYTDSVSGGYAWHGAGDRHVCQALQEFRRKMNIPAKMVVNAMEANNCSIADPNDAGMMDVVGFDAAAPAIITDFIRG